MAADLSRLSYFSLPGEIRNKIMGYVLVPGDIQPCRPVSETSAHSPDTTAKIVSRPGIQLIATCKQAYNEGHKMFYSCNTFHLEPTLPFWWPDRLQAKHKAMIKRISFTIGLVELTPAMLHQIENNMSVVLGDKDGSRWGKVVRDAQTETWESNLRYLLAWNSLEEIELCSLYNKSVLRHHDIVAELEQHDPHHYTTLRLSHALVYFNIIIKVLNVGWKKTKEWLYVRRPDELAE